MRIERTIAAAVLALGLSALLYAQAPGLFSTLEVDGDATFYHSGIIDAHNLHTATGSSTGIGERIIAIPSEYTFAPTMTGDALCSVSTSALGWTISTNPLNRWGEVDVSPPPPTFLPNRTDDISVSDSDYVWLLDYNTGFDGRLYRLDQGDLTATAVDYRVSLSDSEKMVSTTDDIWIVSQSSTAIALNRFSKSNLVPRIVGVPITLNTPDQTVTVLAGESVTVTELAVSPAAFWFYDTSGTNSVWSIPSSNLTATGVEHAISSDWNVSASGGMAYDGAGNLVLRSGRDFYIAPVSNISSSSFLGEAPVSTSPPGGITVNGIDLWTLKLRVLPSRVLIERLPLSNPDATVCGGSNGTSTVAWRNMTSSDNPSVWARRTAAGAIVAIWQGEDQPMSTQAMPMLPWEVTTDTLTSPGPPPTATLASLYAGADTDDRTAALHALSAYVSARGWLSGVSAVGDIVNVPERGCGAPGGDCEPAARLHALRALAEAVHPDAPDAVFALVAEALRVDAAGVWSVAP